MIDNVLGGLIERAAAKAGSLRKLAAEVECSSAYLTEVRKGRCGLDPKYAVRIAAFLGERADDYVLRAVASSANTDEDKAFWNEWLGKFQALLQTAGLAAGITAGALLLPVHDARAVSDVSDSSGADCNYRTRRKPLKNRMNTPFTSFLSEIIGLALQFNPAMRTAPTPHRPSIALPAA